MPTVRGTLRNAANVAVEGIVTIRLITSLDGSRPPAFLAGGVTVISAVQPDVEPDGDWSTALQSNFDPGLVPAGTYYEVIQQAPREPARGFAIQVPLGGGPYDVDNLVLDAPASMPDSGLSATHIGASPAHAATSVGYDPSGSGGQLAATDVQAALDELAAETIGAFVWTQADALAVWTVPHELGRKPIWYLESSVLNPDGTRDELHPSREDPSLTLTLFDFDGVPESGFAHGR